MQSDEPVEELGSKKKNNEAGNTLNRDHIRAQYPVFSWKSRYVWTGTMLEGPRRCRSRRGDRDGGSNSETGGGKQRRAEEEGERSPEWTYLERIPHRGLSVVGVVLVVAEGGLLMMLGERDVIQTRVWEPCGCAVTTETAS